MARKPAASVSISGTPSYGETITLSVTANVQSLVHVVCRNDTGIVLSAGGRAHEPGSYTEDVTLASPSYTGGHVSCEAVVKTWSDGGSLRLREIASTEFEVTV